MHLPQLVDRLDHNLSFHAGLLRYILKAVPTIVNLRVPTLADKQIHEHLTRRKLFERLALNEEVTACQRKLLYTIIVCTFVSAVLHAALQLRYKSFVNELVHDLLNSLNGADAAVLTDCRLLYMDDSLMLQRLLCCVDAAQIRIHAQFLDAQALIEYLVA